MATPVARQFLPLGEGKLYGKVSCLNPLVCFDGWQKPADLEYYRRCAFLLQFGLWASFVFASRPFANPMPNGSANIS
jgi:hypothetical protein